MHCRTPLLEKTAICSCKINRTRAIFQDLVDTCRSGAETKRVMDNWRMKIRQTAQTLFVVPLCQVRMEHEQRVNITITSSLFRTGLHGSPTMEQTSMHLHNISLPGYDRTRATHVTNKCSLLKAGRSVSASASAPTWMDGALIGFSFLSMCHLRLT